MIKLLILLLMATGTSVSPAPTEQQIKDATVAVASQHTLVATLSAIHFCKFGKWPDSLNSLQMVWEAAPLPMPVQPNWNILLDEGTSYRVTDSVVLTTPQGALPFAHAVTSTNKPPECNGKKVKLNAHMQIGSP